jgi:Domain of unknown function (DUF4274)
MTYHGWLSDEEVSRLEAWLPVQSPRVWHQVALTWNWDNGTYFLDWILNQPACDKGTALSIYLGGEPGFYADAYETLDQMREDPNAASHLPMAEFLARICQRWSLGHFVNYEFHPGEWFDRRYGWGEVPPGMISPNAPWPVPDDMVAAPLRGEAVDLSSFSEGMPNAWIEPLNTRPSLSARIAHLLSKLRGQH